MRKTKAIRERCANLRKITGVIDAVWLKHEGYYTYQLFFKSQNEAESQIATILSKYPKMWVEYIGYLEMECENEILDSFWLRGHVLEVTFLE